MQSKIKLTVVKYNFPTIPQGSEWPTRAFTYSNLTAALARNVLSKSQRKNKSKLH